MKVKNDPRSEALIFFRLLLSSCLNWKIHCEDHSSLSPISAVQKYMNYFIYTYIMKILDRHDMILPNELRSFPSIALCILTVHNFTGN